MISMLLVRRWLSMAAILLAILPLSGCAGAGSRWLWNPFASQNFKDGVDAMTGRSGYNGLDPRARDIERSLNSHF